MRDKRGNLKAVGMDAQFIGKLSKYCNQYEEKKREKKTPSLWSLLCSNCVPNIWRDMKDEFLCLTSKLNAIMSWTLQNQPPAGSSGCHRWWRAAQPWLALFFFSWIFLYTPLYWPVIVVKRAYVTFGVAAASAGRITLTAVPLLRCRVYRGHSCVGGQRA